MSAGTNARDSERELQIRATEIRESLHQPARHLLSVPVHPFLGRPFRHSEQSLRVVEHLENDGRGLNLTWEVREGIAKHSGRSVRLRTAAVVGSAGRTSQARTESSRTSIATEVGQIVRSPRSR